MSNLRGGDSFVVRYLTPSVYTFYAIHGGGSVTYGNILGAQTKVYMMAKNDHILA